MNKSLPFIAMLLLLSCSPKDKGIYLLPPGFKGQVNIIYNQPQGKRLQKEHDYRVYEIPESGILITSEKDVYGIIAHEYYYVANNGTKTALPVFLNNKEEQSGLNSLNRVGIFNDGTSGVYGSSDVAAPRCFQEFYVGTHQDLDSFSTPKSKTNFEHHLKSLIGSW